MSKIFARPVSRIIYASKEDVNLMNFLQEQMSVLKLIKSGSQFEIYEICVAVKGSYDSVVTGYTIFLKPDKFAKKTSLRQVKNVLDSLFKDYHEVEVLIEIVD